MSKIEIWNWDKKKRTMLRSIKPGDIFCFKYNEESYCFGRIISKIWTGHVAEIFDYVSSTPQISEEDIKRSKRIIDPIILDSYSLFDKKQVGEWRIIGRQLDYTPTNIENVYFTYGEGPSRKKVDVFGNETVISEQESKKIPILSPFVNDHIHKLIQLK